MNFEDARGKYYYARYYHISSLIIFWWGRSKLLYISTTIKQGKETGE